MLNHFLNARTLRTMVLAVAPGMLPAMISAPVGAADKPLSKSELKSLIATAETKAEYERIAKYFDAEAARYEAEAAEHGELAQVYRKSGPGSPKYPGSMQTFNHCDSVSKSLQKAAEDARQLAAEHRGMEKEAKK